MDGGTVRHAGPGPLTGSTCGTADGTVCPSKAGSGSVTKLTRNPTRPSPCHTGHATQLAAHQIAAATLSLIPVVLLFIFLQRYFLEGVAGAVKA